ncbi:MAG: serine/threonine-protein kinase [Myxococcales bacterium]|nr:serine/threonine-protein kinase [Myxococcales bacterium]
MTGQRIGNYHVVRQMSQDATGVTYEALHRHSKQRVAVRVLRADLVHDPQSGARLFNDIAALGGVQHRSVVSVHEAGLLPDGAAYIAMEYLEAHTLAQRLAGEGGELDGAFVLSVAWQLAGLLCAAHQRGLVHGDLRPASVLLLPEPAAPAGVRVKLPDLGLSWLDAPRGRSRLEGSGSGPLYLAPEQMHPASETTPQSDVFSLGAVLYQVLGGRPPFGPRGTAEALTAAPLVPLRTLDSSIPPSLDALVQSMLRPNPAERPEMAQVVGELEKLLVDEGVMPAPRPQPPPSRRWKRYVAGAALAGVAFAGLGVLAWHGGLLPRRPAAGTVATRTSPAAPSPASIPPPPQTMQRHQPPQAAPASAEVQLPLVPPPPAETPPRPTPIAQDRAPIPPLRIEPAGKTGRKRPARPARPTGPDIAPIPADPGAPVEPAAATDS